MLERWKRAWAAFKQLPPGKRFQRRYEQQSRRPGSRSPWRRAAWIGGAIVAFAVGVVLMFIPGPAVVFFALAAALIANQSRKASRWLDWLELRLRALYQRAATFWHESFGRHKHASPRH